MSRFSNLFLIFHGSIPTSTTFPKSLKIFALKIGIATAAIYYIKEQHVWKSSNESVKTLEKMKDSCKPYIREIKNQIPVELPEMPETDRLSSLAKESWNKGVLTTFNFIASLPETAREWSSKGIDAAMQNQEVKKFLDSFSSSNTVK